MSKMDRPTLPPAAPNHDQHDPLLVAQLAAGDPLDPARAAEAQSWLATCAECARTASDLGAVRMAVASERVPPRRRDFRLTAEQAERLEGSAVTRFLRRLSLPRARAFAPAAAGLLSVGLVFVVAGYAWPEDGAVQVGTDAVVAPAALEAPTAPTADDAAALDFFTTHPDALEDALSNQVGAPPRTEAMQKALEAEGLDEVDRAFGGDLEQGAVAAPEMSAGPAGATLLPDGAESAVSGAGEAFELADEVEASGGRALETADDLALGATTEEADGAGVADAAVETQSAAAEPAVSVGDADDGALERWLVLIGVLLAVTGGALLLLGWLSRRASDPLLR